MGESARLMFGDLEDVVVCSYRLGDVRGEARHFATRALSLSLARSGGRFNHTYVGNEQQCGRIEERELGS